MAEIITDTNPDRKRAMTSPVEVHFLRVWELNDVNCTCMRLWREKNMKGIARIKYITS